MDLYFWIFATLAVVSGTVTILWKDPLTCALGLLTVFMSLASLYLHLHAPFVAIFQVAIYAGAILVLVIFVIMLLTSPDQQMGVVQHNVSLRILGAELAVCLMAMGILAAKGVSEIVGAKALPDDFGHPSLFGKLFFRNFILHFEVASVLLLVALIGGVFLARKRS